MEVNVFVFAALCAPFDTPQCCGVVNVFDVFGRPVTECKMCCGCLLGASSVNGGIVTALDVLCKARFARRGQITC